MSNFKEFYVKVADDLTIEQIVVKGVELGYRIMVVDHDYIFAEFFDDGSIYSETNTALENELTPSEFLDLKPEDVKPKLVECRFSSDLARAGLGEAAMYSENIFSNLTQSQIDRIKAILGES